MDEHEIFNKLDQLSKKDPVAVEDVPSVSNVLQSTSSEPSPPPFGLSALGLLRNTSTSSDLTAQANEAPSQPAKSIDQALESNEATNPITPDTTTIAPDSSLSTQTLKEILPQVAPIRRDAVLSPNSNSLPASVANITPSPTVERKSQGVGTPPVLTTPKVEAPETPKMSTDAQPPRDWTSELRERELDRRSREIDRRERELERRERELERRQRELEYDKARWTMEVRSAPQWHDAIETLQARFDATLLAERKKALEREVALEASLMRKVNEILDKDRQMYSVAQMSDREVNEMMESSVGYLLQSDDDIADRVRFQSLLYLSQERLAMEAGLQPASGSGSLSLAWRIALGPSVVTEIRHNKALELLKDRELDESTKKVIESKTAMEYVVEFTSHLRKEGSEMGDHSFAPGRISREAYLESVQRQASQGAVDYNALVILVDFICPK